MYYLQIELSKPVTAAPKGYCIVHYTEQVEVKESYMHEFVRSELQLCTHGFGYYNCWRDVKKQEPRIKTVPKSVTRTRTECCAGYKNTTVHENVFSCEPICDPPCIDGHCTMPGNCTCFQGFEHQDSNKCIPSCKPSCTNGLCTSPGHCECMQGYDYVNSSYCEPHCSSGCKNGVCHKPEDCLCNTGYKKNSSNPIECEPICDTECINATCTAYNVCTCLSGYGKHPAQDNVCKPICELECLHGDCTAPNTCTCHDGYSKNDSFSNICVPDCTNCLNGFCNLPNVCNCHQNYTYNEDGRCEPICNNCSNGTCIAPYDCECNNGYQPDNDGKCIPYCDSCDNGECVEPNVCNCFEGYQSSTWGCYPLCQYGCFAGTCVAPNNCSCEGYGRVEENVCFPLQQNGTNSSENITPERFVIDIMKISNSIDIYNLSLSTIYIKINCSYATTYNFSSNSESHFSNSIECSNIKSALGLYVLCIWNGFSSDIQNFYTDSLDSFIHELNETETEKHYSKLGMTVLFSRNMMSQDEHCYLCPSEKHLRTKMPSNFNISLVACDLEHLQNAVISYNWKGIEVIGLAILSALLLISLLLVIVFRKYLRRDYYGNSSCQIDQIALSLNQED
ncbi:unnamed protein product [Nezara viridula]|uniref:EGF-like domain-containing protein n=1 Tax=Nezara viridula TaxID=85310 RepID=A0A9P0HD52_NEZVI|nr:unnamed protein product [Nezara viridula]